MDEELISELEMEMELTDGYFYSKECNTFEAFISKYDSLTVQDDENLRRIYYMYYLICKALYASIIVKGTLDVSLDLTEGNIESSDEELVSISDQLSSLEGSINTVIYVYKKNLAEKGRDF